MIWVLVSVVVILAIVADDLQESEARLAETFSYVADNGVKGFEIDSHSTDRSHVVIGDGSDYYVDLSGRGPRATFEVIDRRLGRVVYSQQDAFGGEWLCRGSAARDLRRYFWHVKSQVARHRAERKRLIAA